MIELCDQRLKAIEEEEEAVRQGRLRLAEEKKAEEHRLEQKRQKKVLKATLSVFAVILLIVALILFVNYIKYKPLRDALRSDEIKVELINEKYSDLQNDKKGLKVFEKELEKCHKHNDIEKALDILVALSECDVEFSGAFYESSGVKCQNPHIMAWYSFTNWLLDEAEAKGKKVEIEKFTSVQVYEVYGYKVYGARNSDGNCVIFNIQLSDDEWYEVNAAKKDGNEVYHRKNGGVMID